MDLCLDDHYHVDVVEPDDSASPAAVGVDVWMVLESPCQTAREKTGERQCCARLFPSVVEACADLGDVELDESVDVASPAGHAHRVDGPASLDRERLGRFAS